MRAEFLIFSFCTQGDTKMNHIYIDSERL